MSAAITTEAPSAASSTGLKSKVTTVIDVPIGSEEDVVPFVPLRLGRFGKVPSVLTLAPFATALWIDAPAAPARGWHGAIGVGVLTLFDQLRFGVARGVRSGRWTFSVDLSSALWPIL